MTVPSRRPLALMPTRLHTGQLLPCQHLGAAADLAMEPHAVARAHAVEPIRLDDPGSCPPHSTIVAIVLDESASVTTHGGTDPLSRRHAEAALAIHHVAGACRCGHDRICLVPFDVDSAGYVAPQLLTSRGMRRIDRGLHRLANGWGQSSKLGPALEHVMSHAANRREGVAVVVFSDFLLTDANPAAVLLRLRSVPGYVHAVVLGTQPPDVLVNDPTVTVTRLTPSSPPGTTARAVFDGLTRYRRRDPTGQSTAAHRHQNTDDEGELIA